MRHNGLIGRHHGRRHCGHFHGIERDAVRFDGWCEGLGERASGFEFRNEDEFPDDATRPEYAPPHEDLFSFAYERALMADATQSEKLFDLFHRVAHLFPRGPHHEGGMHPGQSRILAILADKGSITQREMLDMLQVRSASLSELLHKLERSGHIVREKDPEDRRNVILSLSERGEEAYRENAQSHVQRAAATFSALDEKECEQLEALLSKLLTAWRLVRADRPARPHGHGPLGRDGCPHHPPHHHRHHPHRHGMGPREFDRREHDRPGDDGEDDV